jgi:DNA invertase Pin-like site-specific DNA recombinase
MKLRPRHVPHDEVKTKRCAIYTRKSTSVGLDQDFNSLDAQREACVGYIARQAGWKVIDTAYDDGGFTGANVERPAFQRLLRDIDAGRIDVVVVYKADRLSRSLLDFAQVMERFNLGGASFVSVTQNFSTADAMGRLTLNMLMSFAEFELEMISERTRDKISASRRKGKWTGGPVPLGYTVEEKKLVVNELEAVLVREIFALYHEHRSSLVVTRMLNERQATKKPRPTAYGERSWWTTNDVRRVLKNPIYAGYMASGDELFESEHSSIIERSVFARTQALLAGATRDRSVGVRNPEYLLRGVLRCARCRSPFTTASTTSGRSTHRYYRCVTRDKRGKEACASRPLPAEAIEVYVVERLRDATLDGTLAAEVTESVRARVAVRRKDLRIEHRKLPPQIADLAAAVIRTTETSATVTGPAMRVVEARLQDASDQLARAERRLAAVERELAVLEAIEVEASWVADRLSEFHRIWDVLSAENRGRLLRAVIERVEVDEPSNEVKLFFADLAAGVPAPDVTTALAVEGSP